MWLSIKLGLNDDVGWWNLGWRDLKQWSWSEQIVEVENKDEWPFTIIENQRDS